MQGRRREENLVVSNNLASRIWVKFWNIIYKLVAVATYVLMIVGLIYTCYFTFINFDIPKAFMAGLATVLIVYINKVNPN